MSIPEQIKVVLPRMGDRAIVVGMSASLTQRNIAILRRVFLNGESRKHVLDDMGVSINPNQVTRIAKKFCGLQIFDAKLEDGMSQVPIPTVWAGSFGAAARFIKNRYCGHLELPLWKLRYGNTSVLLRDID